MRCRFFAMMVLCLGVTQACGEASDDSQDGGDSSKEGENPDSVEPAIVTEEKLIGKWHNVTSYRVTYTLELNADGACSSTTRETGSEAETEYGTWSLNGNALSVSLQTGPDGEAITPTRWTRTAAIIRDFLHFHVLHREDGGGGLDGVWSTYSQDIFGGNESWTLEVAADQVDIKFYGDESATGVAPIREEESIVYWTPPLNIVEIEHGSDPELIVEERILGVRIHPDVIDMKNETLSASIEDAYVRQYSAAEK